MFTLVSSSRCLTGRSSCTQLEPARSCSRGSCGSASSPRFPSQRWRWCLARWRTLLSSCGSTGHRRSAGQLPRPAPAPPCRRGGCQVGLLSDVSLCESRPPSLGQRVWDLLWSPTAACAHPPPHWPPPRPPLAAGMVCFLPFASRLMTNCWRCPHCQTRLLSRQLHSGERLCVGQTKRLLRAGKFPGQPRSQYLPLKAKTWQEIQWGNRKEVDYALIRCWLHSVIQLCFWLKCPSALE